MIITREILNKLGLLGEHRCNDLVPYSEVFALLREAQWQAIGPQNVPLDRIVGSAGRFRDFDLMFNPRHDTGDGRQTSIAEAHSQGVSLPPPLLYKVATAYFVEDGNHRISAARSRGAETIRAQVVEIDPDGLLFEPSCSRLGFKLSRDNPA